MARRTPTWASYLLGQRSASEKVKARLDQPVELDHRRVPMTPIFDDFRSPGRFGQDRVVLDRRLVGATIEPCRPSVETSTSSGWILQQLERRERPETVLGTVY